MYNEKKIKPTLVPAELHCYHRHSPPLACWPDGSHISEYSYDYKTRFFFKSSPQPPGTEQRLGNPPLFSAIIDLYTGMLIMKTDYQIVRLLSPTSCFIMIYPATTVL